MLACNNPNYKILYKLERGCSAQMPPSPRMHKPYATIIKKNVTDSKNDSKLEKKNIPLVCRARRDKSIDA